MEFPAKHLKSDLLFFVIVATASLLVGLLINQIRDKPLPLVYQSKEARMQQSVTKIAANSDAAKPAVQGLPEVLSLEEFADYVGAKRGLILDARPEIFHRLGHVPGAVSFPREDFENAYVALKSKLESDKNQPIAIYCSGPSCEDSDLVAKSLRGLGYQHVAVFKGGWGEWTGAGKPEEAAK